MLNIGIHVSREGDLIKQLRKTKKLGFRWAQIFLIGPFNYTSVTEMNQKKITHFKQQLDTIGINLIVHGSYVDYPWTDSKVAINNIKREMKYCEILGIKYLVIHLPKKPLSTVTKLLPKLESKKVTLLLEINAAKSSPQTWETPEKLNRLCKFIYEKKLNIGITVDTAHIWASGYDISTINGATNWIKGLQYPQLIKVIHLNDDANPLGSGKDRHSPIGTNIWKKNKKALKPFLVWAKKQGIIIILEHKPSAKQFTKNVLLDANIIDHLLNGS